MDWLGILLVGSIAVTILFIFLLQFFSDRKRKINGELIKLVAYDLKMPNSSRDFEKVIKNVKDEVKLKVSY